MTCDQWIEARWKRGSLPFNTLFDSSRYDFRFSRYPRAEKMVIFDPFTILVIYSDLSLASPTYPKLQTSDRRDSWKDIARNS